MTHSIDREFDTNSKTEFLIRGARSGNSQAWGHLFKRYHTLLEAVVRIQVPGYARAAYDGDDILQQAFASAWEKRGTFSYRGERSFRNWLQRIIVNEANEMLRKRGREPRHKEIDSDVLAKQSQEQETPDEQMSRLEEEERLIACLRALSEQDQEVLLMHHFEKLKLTEIAALLELSPSGARKRRSTALQRLATCLAGS